MKILNSNMLCSIVLILVFWAPPVFAQVGIGTGTPNSSAVLELVSTSKGLLVPRLTSAQTAAITLPATSLLIYQTDGSPGFYYNAGTPGLPNWIAISGPDGTVSSISTGTGLTGGPITATGTISAQNTVALWNANSLQGTSVSATAPVNGQLLQFNGNSWAGAFSTWANMALSNLTSTSINQSLLPNNSGVYNLGSSTLLWNSAWFTGNVNLNITASIAGINVEHYGNSGTPIKAVINSAANSTVCLLSQTYGTGRLCEFDNFNESNPNSLIYLANAGTGKWLDAGGNAYLSSGGTNWVNASDVNAKQNIVLVNGKSILSKINQLSISEWSYKFDRATVRHIGPMAQDFYDLFGLGQDDRSISTIDPAGIALAGIKELSKMLDSLLAEVVELKVKLSTLQQNAK